MKYLFHEVTAEWNGKCLIELNTKQIHAPVTCTMFKNNRNTKRPIDLIMVE